MKVHTLSLIAAFGAVTLLGGCSHSGEPVGRDKLYNNFTDADSEAFEFFKTVHEKAVHETELAKYVQTAPASAEAKSLAAEIVKVYDAIIPELEELATKHHVILPSVDLPAFAVPQHFVADSLAGFNSAAYITHAQHEQGAILEQVKRASRNTVRDVRAYASEKLAVVNAVFAAAGGEVDHAAHH